MAEVKLVVAGAVGYLALAQLALAVLEALEAMAAVVVEPIPMVAAVPPDLAVMVLQFFVFTSKGKNL